jgi:3-hydroxyacyl-[acyl-carrier-protein] dehydratase
MMRGWVDRVDVLEPSIKGVGRWNLPETLEIFDSHFPRFPVVPGTLLLQALVELAIVVVQDVDRPAWDLNIAEEIRFRRYVRPGDEVELSVDVVEDSGEAVDFRARATVDGTPVMTVRRLELVARTADAGTTR